MYFTKLLWRCPGRNRKCRVTWMVLICVGALCCTVLLIASVPDSFHRHDLVNDQDESMVRRKIIGKGNMLPANNFRWFAEHQEYMDTENSHFDQVLDEDLDEIGSYDDSISLVNSSLVSQMLNYTARKYSERVLILSPIHNVARLLPHYASMLKSLTYPRELISVALGEDSSTDGTMSAAKDTARVLEKHFTSVKTFHLGITGGVHGAWEDVHDRDAQLARRSHLAEARNRLLNASLKDEDWVLWVDSDVGEMPRDIIQQLLSAEKDIVAPVCLMRDEEIPSGKRVYDKNTWRETKNSLLMQKLLAPDALVLEGYGRSYRKWLSALRNEGRVVPLDGVGGCTLLIRADCHRKGLVFPTTVYDHHIETEGLAKMAKKMKFGVFGMPFVEVIHS